MQRSLTALALGVLLAASTLAGCSSSSNDPCDAGLTECNGTCVDLQSDRLNCGECGFACELANECSAATCQATAWKELTTLGATVMFTDYSPKDETSIYALSDGELAVYSTTDGALTPLASAPSSIGGYTGPAWSGDKLYVFDESDVLAYSIADDEWTTVVDGTVPVSVNNTQATADDAGHVYASSSGLLLVLDTSDGSVLHHDAPIDLGSSEPRAAWDSASGKLYLADYDATEFYAFDPAGATFQALPEFPGTDGGFSDAFCSDRNGHIFSAGSSCADDAGAKAELWVYTAAKSEWSQLPELPFLHGCEASCTVVDGYLYFMDGEADHLARIKL